MQVVTAAPQISGELLSVGPDMANIVAGVALRKASLSSIWFYLDDNRVLAIQLQYLLRFYVSHLGNKEEWPPLFSH
jgi:hypothetical protein